MKLGKLYDKLNKTFPFEDQVEFDNSGLQIGSREKKINNVFLTLDVTDAVIDEAISKEADIIISHHPLFYHSLKNIDYDNYYGNIIRKLIINDIAVVSLHTNYDKNPIGMNFQLLASLKAKNIVKHPDDEFMFLGEVDTDLNKFIALVKRTFNRNGIRYAGSSDITLKKIAVIGGSGGSVDAIHAAKKENVDLFITADVKSYDARYAKEIGVNILDVSHNVEEIFTYSLYNYLENDGFNISISKIDTDPFDFI